MTKNMEACQWFLNCTATATQTRPHPTLGDVPICKRCDDRGNQLNSPTYNMPPMIVAALVGREDN